MARKDFKTVNNVQLSRLMLDPGNPRIRSAHDQNECIERVLRKEAQMLALMKSIAEDGLTTMPIIVKINDDGSYTVMDGNRRVTALKLLNNPDICPVEHLKARIKQLRSKNIDSILKKVDVMASSDDDAIAKEVLARHAGAAGGAGQLNWSAYLRTVFELNHGHPAQYRRPGQYAMWAEEQGVDVDDDFPITSLERFFNKENLLLLGFKITKDTLVPTMSLDLVKKMAQTVISDFASGKKRVEDVWTPELSLSYIQTVQQSAGVSLSSPNKPRPDGKAGDTPDTSVEPDKKPGEPGGSSANDAGPTEQAPVKEGTPNDKGARQPTPRLHPADRSKIFGTKAPGLPIPAEEVKATAMVVELRNLTLKGAKGTPIAATFLLRGLIEVSDSYYRKKHRLADKQKLALNIRSSSDHMRQAGKIDGSEHDIISRYINSNDTLLHIENLQKMMHRTTHLPDYHRLNTIWDEFGCFVRACWVS